MSRDLVAIRRDIASGAAWMISFRMCDRLIGVLSTAILARLLDPEHFGVLAVAITFTALLDAVGEFNFELPLIRDQQAGKEHYDTAWTIRLIKAGVLFGLLNSIAVSLSEMVSEPRIVAVIRLISFAVLLDAAQSMRIVDLRKDLEFDREFRYRMATRLVGFVSTLAFVLWRRDELALVYGMLITDASRVVLSYAMKPYRPSLCLSRFGEIFDFSKWILAANLFRALLSRSPALVIARFWDAQIVGFFAISETVSALASTELVSPIKRALFPSYAKLVSAPDTLRDVYLENFSVIVMVSMPIAAGIGLTAELIVPLFLGAKWMDAVPVLQVLAIHAALRTININSNPLYYATNRPQFALASWAIEALVLVPALLLTVPEGGALGAAVAAISASAVVTVFDSWLVVGLLEVSWLRFLRSFWRTSAAILVMTVGVSSVKTLLTSAHLSSLVPRLAVVSVLGALLFVGSHLALWRLGGCPTGAESIVTELVRRYATRWSIGRRLFSAVGDVGHTAGE